jgi:hypothetical protein
MHRLLTGYSQYYNRRHRRVGHLFQGRYKARLCQSDRYLSELVRYIHLNPVRAGLVDVPEEYEYSGHRAYLGLAPSGLVDVDPVLRHFGARKPQAQKRYRDFVMAGMKLGHQEEFYLGDESRILGSEEFVDATIHRIGESKRGPRPNGEPEFGDAEISRLIIAVEKSCGVPRTEFSCSSKNARMVLAKEMLIVTGHQLGANLKLLSELSGLSSGSVSRRHDAAKAKIANEAEVAKLVARITREYHLRSRIAESKA